MSVYILRCARGTYYIGKTAEDLSHLRCPLDLRTADARSLGRRIAAHISGRGSEWTKLHPPETVLKVITPIDDHTECNTTIDTMREAGVEQVRGSLWSSVRLSSAQLKMCRDLCWDASDACHKCGERGHFAKSCPGRSGSLAAGQVCARCGRKSHIAAGCYAKRHAGGEAIVEVNEDVEAYEWW